MRFLRFIAGRILDNFTIIDHIVAKFRNLELSTIISLNSQPIAVVAALNPNINHNLETISDIRILLENNFKVVIISRNPTLFYQYFPDNNITIIEWTSSSRDFYAFNRIWFNALSNPYEQQGIVFINDSMRWNNDFALLLLDMLQYNEAAIFPTLSNQVRKHLQPYFVVFPKKFPPTDINEYFSIAKNWHFKRTAVHWGEMKILKNIKKHDINFKVLFDHEDMHRLLARKCGFPNFFCKFNPYLVFDDFLFNEFGFKKRVIQRGKF